jgi:hypothetical protein
MISSTLAQMNSVDSTEHMVIVLDPLGTGNGPEIVHVTAHTASSTGATIVRGREGTSGVAHTSTTAWVHGMTVSDLARRGLVATRDAITGGIPFEGQLWYTTDDDELTVYNGVAWEIVHHTGDAETYTPTMTADSGSPAVGGGSLIGRYVRAGRKVDFWIYLKLGAGTTFANGTLRFDLPFACAQWSSQDRQHIGSGSAVQSNVREHRLSAEVVFATSASKISMSSELATQPVSGSAGVPFVWTSGDYLMVSGTYVAAS